MNQEFEISSEYIELNKLLKASGMCDSGGFAKMVVKDRLVTVDGEIETRVRRKIYNEMIIKYNNQTLQVIRKKKFNRDM